MSCLAVATEKKGCGGIPQNMVLMYIESRVNTEVVTFESTVATVRITCPCIKQNPNFDHSAFVCCV